MTYTIQPHGVCSRSMTVETDDQGVIQKLEVVGGCDGNLKGISALVVGMKAEEAVRRLRVENFPLTVVLDTHGGDLYESGPAAWLASRNGNE